ncbi:MAG TPA: carboxylesterase/lipase family protein [Acidimicrobiia bacterium]|nr:carboxylesterase/lipase family protein [Acidimicrobiia bacterium]
MTIAATRSGKIEGIEQDGVLVFRGIPFAAPPVGPRRFLPPAREEAWDGVRDATRFGSESAQADTPIARMLGSNAAHSSEDSLYLNVWTPACDDAARPVMVWIHGGAYVFGSGAVPWYDGTRFVQHGDVVVVTINYRLGAFGFLHLADQFGDELAGSGNAGILDQVAALEWVRDCIATFGGNPNDVTVFGESAGANSVATMLAMPTARGLFGKAIAQSAAGAWVSTRERAGKVARRTTEKLGVSDIDALRSVSKERLLAANPDLTDEAEEGIAGLPWQPAIDDATLFELPRAAVASGSAVGVHLLTGTNEHEMTLFQILDPGLADLDDAQMIERLRPWADDPARLLRAYRAAAPEATPQQIWLALTTDGVFRIPAIHLSEAQLPHGPVWMYRFSWETPAFGGALRSTHALEIPFVFDNLDRNTEGVTGNGPERQAIADTMHRAWIAFARNGDPGWPAYDATRRTTMRFDTASDVVDDPEGTQRAAWETADT